MKKVLFTIIAVFVMAAAANAQSIQWHQSYDGNQKFVADFFKSDSNFNVFSYNEFTVTDNHQAVGYGILYGEYRIAGSHLLGHLETRFRTSSLDTNVFTVPPAMYLPDHNMINAGFAYELLLGNFCFNLTPMYRYDFGSDYKHNWQFSINSSADFDHIYYEGYLDTWGPKTFNLCTEQKFYYKITPMVHVGVNLMLFTVKDVKDNDPKFSVHGKGSWNFQPWLVARLAF